MARILLICLHLVYGGASKLNLSIAKALQDRGHDVRIVTSRHEPSYSFKESSEFHTTVVGAWLPNTICGHAYDLCLNIRVLYLTLYSLLSSLGQSDLIILDRCAAAIPLLRLCGKKILFYCHYPEKLDWKRGTRLGRLYRWPLDMLESFSIRWAHSILVNSHFTAKACRDVLPAIRQRELKVLHPIIDYAALDTSIQQAENPVRVLTNGKMVAENRNTFLVLSRYDENKKMELAIEAFDQLLLRQARLKETCRLVIAGALDDVIPDRRLYYNKLRSLVKLRQLSDHVTFLVSVTDETRALLLKTSVCLLFTSPNEHFGIVPLEAMYLGCPVIAVNQAGPVESVNHGVTGFLCPPRPSCFANAMQQLLQDGQLRHKMSVSAKEAVTTKFSFHVFTENINNEVAKVIGN